MIPNSSPEWGNFQCAPNNHYGFFFLHTPPSSTAFKLKCVLLCQFYAKISTFLVKKISVWGFYFRRWRYDVWQKWCQKPTWWRQNWHLDVLMFWRHAWESSYTPRCRTSFSSTGWVHGNSCLVCKKELSCRWMLLWLSLVERPLHNSGRSWVFSSTICQHGTCWCRKRRLQKSSR